MDKLCEGSELETINRRCVICDRSVRGRKNGTAGRHTPMRETSIGRQRAAAQRVFIDTVLQRNTAHQTLDELVAIPGYRPTLRSFPFAGVVADAYDREMIRRRDPRRANRV